MNNKIKISDDIDFDISANHLTSVFTIRDGVDEVILTEKEMESICYEFMQHQRRKFSRQGRS